MQALLDWLGALPPATLYLAMFVVAAAENFFPPIPADVTVAFGAFLAARGGGSPLLPFLAVWLGNVGGAMVMYALGRRFGAAWIRERLGKAMGDGAEVRVTAWYERYGAGSLFVSRFLPGVRAVVPPLAGALRIAPLRPTLAIALASGLWYGFITWLAFRAGASWEQLQSTIARYGRGIAVGAAALVALFIIAWFVRRARAARPVVPSRRVAADDDERG